MRNVRISKKLEGKAVVREPKDADRPTNPKDSGVQTLTSKGVEETEPFRAWKGTTEPLLLVSGDHDHTEVGKTWGVAS